MQTVRGAKVLARRWAGTATEVFLDHRGRFPEIMAKAIVGRALYGFGPAAFFMADLNNRPLSTWGNHMKDSDDLWAGLRAVNWSSDGLRLSRDKVVASERCTAEGVASAPIRHRRP